MAGILPRVYTLVNLKPTLYFIFIYLSPHTYACDTYLVLVLGILHTLHNLKMHAKKGLWVLNWLKWAINNERHATQRKRKTTLNIVFSVKWEFM